MSSAKNSYAVIVLSKGKRTILIRAKAIYFFNDDMLLLLGRRITQSYTSLKFITIRFVSLCYLSARDRKNFINLL